MSIRRVPDFVGHRARVFLLLFAAGGLVPLGCMLQTNGLGASGGSGPGGASSSASSAVTSTSGSGGATSSSSIATTSTATGSMPVCGNGKLEAGEECDDGNQVDTDACRNDCKNAKCGDGVVEMGVEECDDGNQVDTDACRNDCKNARCGDGVVETGVEQCDDGNSDDTDACPGNCQNARCGDGFVQKNVEQCDDGNQVNTDACLNSCKTATCGDGVVEMGVEQCDDGNTTPFDRCGATCHTEDPTTCPGTAVSIAAGQTLVINDTTAGASDKFVGSPQIGNCNQSNAWTGPDLIYAVTPATSGMLQAVLVASYGSSFVRIRPACPGGNQSDLGCQFHPNSNATDTVQVAVTAGTTYYVAADSYADQSGAFKLTLTLQ